MSSAPFPRRRAWPRRIVLWWTRRALATRLALGLAAIPGLAVPAAAGDPAAAEVSAEPPPAAATAGGAAPPSSADDSPPAIAPPPPPLIRVDPVTVTATRAEREVLDAPGHVTVIDREAIERSGAQTVADLLRREAGIFVTNTTSNPEGATVEARGFNNGGGNGSRTLVLMDGRRLNEPSSSQTDWAFLRLDNVERIEVVRGPASAVWGDNAIGGVIQILTRHPEEDGVRLHARARSGTDDLEAGSVQVEARQGSLSASLFTDSFTTHAFRDRADFRRRTGTLDLRFEGERLTLGLQGGYSSSDRQRPGDLTKDQIEADREQAEPGSLDDALLARERWGQARLELRPTERVELRLLSFHRRRTDRGSTSAPEFLFDLERESDAVGLNSQLRVDHDLFGRPARTLLGADLLQEDVDNQSFFAQLAPDGAVLFSQQGDDDNRRKLWGAFLQHELWIRDDLQLALGVRRDRARYEGENAATGEDFQVTHNEWAPRAALTWRFVEPVSVYASWARGFRFPNFDEASGFFGFAPELEPESSETWEVGLKVRSQRASLNVALYTMDVDDEILFNPFAENPVLPGLTGLNVNVDRVRHRGLELSSTLRPLEWLELFGSYTFDDVKFTRDTETGFEGNRLPLVPEHRGTAGLRLLLPFGFELSGHGRFVGSRPVANDLGNLREKLPKFASYDARVAWTGALSEALSLTVEANGFNLTDREFNEFGGQSSFPPFPLGFFPSPDRHYVVSLRVTVTP